MDRKIRGNFAEDYAASLLKSRGYRIIDRNFSTTFAEIDMIAIDNDCLVFVEVKARWGVKYGMPEEAVNNIKLNRIKKAGDLFILKNKNLPKKVRIDVVSLIFEKDKVISEKIIKVY